MHLWLDHRKQLMTKTICLKSQAQERSPVTHNALVAGSQKAADDQDIYLKSQAQERSPVTHNALVAGSQKAADDQDICLESQTTCGTEYQEMSLEKRQKSAKAEKEDGCEQITDDEDVPGTDEVCSLRSSRKTFSLNSSPLLKPARESLELHNVLSEGSTDDARHRGIYGSRIHGSRSSG